MNELLEIIIDAFIFNLTTNKEGTKIDYKDRVPNNNNKSKLKPMNTFFKIISLCIVSMNLCAQNRLILNQNVYAVITNSAYLVIDNANANGITTIGTGGNIISENENNVVQWNINTNTGNYIVPFCTNSLVKIPLAVNLVVAGSGANSHLILSTYETSTDANIPYPSDVTNMNSNCNNNNGLYAIDRFWRIDAGSYTTKPTPVINFRYNAAANEMVGTNTIIEPALRAERFNSFNNAWETPQKLYGIDNSVLNTVSGVSITPADFFKSWTLIDTTIMVIPITALSGSICNGSQAVITPTGATTYTLLPGSISSNSSFTVNPTINTTYTISGTLGSGTTTCKSSAVTNATPTIYINATPTLAITGTSVICSGKSATLTVLSANTYSWSNGTIISSNVVSPLATTIYTAIGTNTYAAGNCTATAIYSVNVNATPTLAITGSSVICSGKTTTLTALAATGYFWNTGATTNTISVSPSSSTVYTAMASNTYAASNCTTSATYTVNVNATPTLAITGSSVICSGKSSTITALSANNYSWSNGANTSSNVVSPTANTIYTAIGTNTYAAGNCTNTAVFSVTVNGTPTLAISGTSIICNGNSTTLTALSANTYSWNNGSIANAVVISPTVNTVYTAIGTNTYVSGSCSVSAIYSVTVNASPTLTVNNPTICLGSTAVLTATANPLSGTTYSWSSGSITNMQSVSPSTNTNYTITATNVGCSSNAIATVTVYPIVTPTTGFSYFSPVCINGSNPSPNTVSGFSSNGIYSSTAGITINSSTGLVTLNSSTAGTYVVTYSVAANACSAGNSSTASIVITNTTIPNTNFFYTSPVCVFGANATPNFSSNFSNGGNYSGVAGVVVDSNSGIIDLVNSIAGTYSISYAIPATLGCQVAGFGTASITINPFITLTISPDVIINSGESTLLMSISSANTYTWFPSVNLSCNTCNNPTASPTLTTTYCLKTSDGICSTSTCVTVSVENPCVNNTLSLPNAFSPNGDGSNDQYCLQGLNCISVFDIIIFDRWGEKVFETSDPAFCWDGTYKGKLLNPAVFVYYANGTFNNGGKVEKRGNITLIK